MIKEVQLQAGHDFPLLIKLGIMDDEDGGTTLADGMAAAQSMVEAGVDAIEVSGGIGGGFFKRGIGKEWTPENEKPYFRERAAALRSMVSVPVALVGGLRSLRMAQTVLDAGEADIVAMSRPFIREPGLVKRWAAGDHRPARCIACNQCHRLLWAPDVLLNYCWQESRSGGSPLSRIEWLDSPSLPAHSPALCRGKTQSQPSDCCSSLLMGDGCMVSSLQQQQH